MPIPSDSKTTPSPEYQQAERFINKSISSMGNESHIEYGTTMDRNTHPSKWKKWLNRLLRLYS